ncbi:MAG: trypsin-like peptidase domain-containing protein [Rhizobacter sp.]
MSIISRFFKNAAVLVFGLTACSISQASLVDLITKAKPSVVIVGTHSPTDNPRFNLRGTGFVVGDGTTVITNAHVLPEAPSNPTVVRQLVVQLLGRPGGLEMRVATVVSVDRNRDLAWLRIEGSPVPALTLGKPAYAPEGTAVAFIGFPIGGALGYSPVTHRGIVSSVTAIAPPMASAQQLNPQAILRLREGSYDIYQLDATAYPGNSGGPLLSVETGEVIGVINSVVVRSSKESALSNPSGITYAIPVRFVTELLERR